MARNRYTEVAADLRRRIRSGELIAGAQLPSVHELAESYKVAGDTLRRAVSVLQDEGLLEVRHGAGTFVRSVTPIVRSAQARLTRAVWGSGRSPWEVDAPDRTVTVEQLVVTRQPVPARHAAALDLPTGTEVVARSRVYVLDGERVMAATSYLPADLAAGTVMEQDDTGRGGIYARLSEAGHAPVRFREEVRWRPATAGERGLLQLENVVHIARNTYDAAGRPVELADMVADPRVYVLTYEFDA